MKRLLLALVAFALCACTSTESIVLDNGSLRLTFDRTTASLVSMIDLETGYEYLDTTVAPQRLWSIVPLNKGDKIAEPTEVRVRKVSRHEVRLSWSVYDSTRRSLFRIGR